VDELVERSLRRAALWEEVKNKLHKSGPGPLRRPASSVSASRGTLAVEPEVILMDEPCSALDPISTARVEDLMDDLKADYTIVIVTHNMQQARPDQRHDRLPDARRGLPDRPSDRDHRRVQPDRPALHQPQRPPAPKPTSPGGSASGSRADKTASESNTLSSRSPMAKTKILVIEDERSLVESAQLQT